MWRGRIAARSLDPTVTPGSSAISALEPGPISAVKRVDFQDPFQKETYRAHRSRFITFSNVSSSIRKNVLDRLPFAENIVMVEDQEWCKRAIESGHSIGYEAHNKSSPFAQSLPQDDLQTAF